MEKKENYEKPELQFGVAAIRCSLLAGSTGSNPSSGDSGNSGDTGGGITETKPVVKDPNDARRRGLSF